MLENIELTTNTTSPTPTPTDMDSKPMGEQVKMNLGDRMKHYESVIDSKLSIKPTESFIVRLDGRSFSKFTRKFVKPFDVVFVKAMGFTMRDLVSKFDAQTGYTHSDEITLIFDAKCDEACALELAQSGIPTPSHLFNGRIQKILSLTSSYCSVRFNHHLNKLMELVKSNYPVEFVNLIESCEQMFDGRIMVFESTNKHEILNHQIWRSIHDCERNAISTYAYTYFGSRKIVSKSCLEMIQMLKEEKGLNWDTDVPMFVKHGIYCKKNLVPKEINGHKCLRTEYVFKQFKINFSLQNLNMLLSKYWSGMGTENDKVGDETITRTDGVGAGLGEGAGTGLGEGAGVEVEEEVIENNDFGTTLDLFNLVI